MIIVLKNIFCFDTIFLQLLVYHGNLCLTSSQLSYFDSGVIIASIQELKRWGKKGTFRQHLQKEVMKTSDFVSVQM